jgi:hypothetical protein
MLNLYLLIVDDPALKDHDHHRFDGPRCTKSLIETLLIEMEN